MFIIFNIKMWIYNSTFSTFLRWFSKVATVVYVGDQLQYDELRAKCMSIRSAKFNQSIYKLSGLILHIIIIRKKGNTSSQQNDDKISLIKKNVYIEKARLFAIVKCIIRATNVILKSNFWSRWSNGLYGCDRIA